MSIFSNINIAIGKVINTVNTIGDLRNYKPYKIEDGDTVIVSAEAVLGDANGGAYVWVEGSTAADDGGNTIKPVFSVGSGRWVKAFGKGPTGTTGPQGPQGPAGPPGSQGPEATDPLTNYLATVPAPEPMYDYFDRTNRLLHGSTLATGQTWNVAGADSSTIEIQDGNCVNVKDANNYSEANYGTQITRAAIQFHYEPTGEVQSGFNASPGLTLIVEEATSARDRMQCHYQIYANGGSVQSGAGGDGLVQLGPVRVRLTPWTRYEMAVEIDKATSTLTVYPPGRANNPLIIPNVAAIASYNGTKFAFQMASGGAGVTYPLKLHVDAISVGERLPMAMGVAGGAMSPEGEMLYGTGALTVQMMPQFRVTTSGWVRIAKVDQQFTTGGFRLQGKFHFEATASDSTVSIIDIPVNYRIGEAPQFGTLDKVNFGNPLVRLRASDDGNSNAYLDAYINVPSGGYADLRVRSTGYHALQITPQINATPLANSTVYEFPGVPTPTTSTTLTTSGWHRIAICGSISSFSMATNIRIVAKDTANRATIAEVQATGQFNGGIEISTVAPPWQSLGGVITQARLSYNSADVSYGGMSLDIFAPNAGSSTVQLTVQFLNSNDSLVTPVNPPVAGVTALPSGSMVVSLVPHAAIAAPTGGTTIDAEARTTLTGVLEALRQIGIILT